MIDAIMKYWPALVLAGSFFTTWASWSAKKHFVSHADLSAISAAMGQRVGTVETRVSQLALDTSDKVHDLEKDMVAVKSRLDAMPTKEDLHRIEVAISNVAGSLQGVAASQKGMERQLHLVMKSTIGDDA